MPHIKNKLLKIIGIYYSMKSMVKKITSIFILFLLCATAAIAATVERSKAISTAKVLLESRGLTGLTLKSVAPVQKNGITVYYVINFNPGGWVLVSGDDTAAPYIGFSPEGSYSLTNVPEACDSWMEGRAQEIAGLWNQGSKNEQWEQEKIATTRAAGDIEPILKVNWNQGKPYNQFCPSDAKGTAYVGCVAVAMAQAMSAARYPARPVGEFSYTSSTYGNIYINYNNETAYNWDNIINGTDSKVWVAHLLYHCGVSIKMDYGINGSGTQTAYIATALQRNFSYPSSVRYYYRDTYAGDWKALVLTELQEGRVVCYSGADVKKGYGHCFNLDGYATGMFHVNWGWGGANNGYFALDGLKDATMDMDYTEQQGVVVGIRAPSDAPSDITLSTDKVIEKQDAGAYVADISVVSEATSPTYNFTITGAYSVVLHNYAPAVFKIVDGKLYTTKTLYKDDGDRFVRITATNTKNLKSVTREFTIEVTDAAGITLVENSTPVRYESASRSIVVNESLKGSSYRLYNTAGTLIQKGTLEGNVGTGNLPIGCYILSIEGAQRSTTKLLIK